MNLAEFMIQNSSTPRFTDCVDIDLTFLHLLQFFQWSFYVFATRHFGHVLRGDRENINFTDFFDPVENLSPTDPHSSKIFPGFQEQLHCLVIIESSVSRASFSESFFHNSFSISDENFPGTSHATQHKVHLTNMWKLISPSISSDRNQ